MKDVNKMADNRQHFADILREMVRDAWAENEALRKAFKEHIDSLEDPKLRSKARTNWPGLFRDRIKDVDLPRYLRRVETTLGKQARIEFELFLPWEMKNVDLDHE